MQAVVFPGPEQMAVQRVADPTPQPDEIVVRVASTGICGTDLHIFRNEYMSDFPVIPGHEFGGRVVEVGKDVTDVKLGDRVAVDPNLYCGHCYFCRNEQANHCLNWQGVGVTRPGSFAEYVAAPAKAAYKVPESIDDAQAAFIEPVSCVVHALKRFRVWPGDEVLIVGAGPMGLILVQALRHSGAGQVVVVEKQPERLALARQLGATAAIAAGPDQDDELRALAPYGFAVVVDATGVPSLIEQEFAYLKPRGQFLQFGVAPNNATIRVSPYDIFRNDWTIIGSFALCYTFERAIAWMASGVIDVKPLISHSVPLAEFPTVFPQFAAGHTLKVQLRPGA